MNAWKSFDSPSNGELLEKLLDGRLDDPRAVLGPQMIENANDGAVSVRAFFPTADKALILNQAEKIAQPMNRVHADGVFEVVCDASVFGTSLGTYKLRYA